MHFMNAFIFLLSLAFHQEQEDIPVLRVGEMVKGVIDDSAASVKTEILDKNYTQAPTVGKGYIIQVSEPGIYTIEMRSLFFDSYLILRNKEGKVIAEDDDGLYGTHSRITFRVGSEAEALKLDACALHGGRDGYELSLRRGKGKAFSPSEKNVAALKDARDKVRIIEEHEGKVSLALAQTLNSLAALLESQGNYEEAKPLYERALAIYEKVLGPEHPDTATSLYNLGALLYARGNYEEAKPLYERALAIYEKVLGPDHPDTAACLGHLAALLYARGNYEEAKPLYERALAIYEKVLGPEHPHTAASLGNLASLLLAQGNYEEAKPLYQRALRICEKVLGPEHPNTAISLGNLAALLESQGNYEEAKPLYQRALRICEKVLGPEHPNTAISRSNLAALLNAQGNYEEAKPLYQRALAISEKVLGPEHPDTATSLGNLALLLKAQGNYEEAKPLYERALRICEKVLGPEHPDTGACLGNLAALLYARGNYEEAKPLYERALRIRGKVLGPEHPNTAISLNNLASLLRAQGNYEEAKPLYQRALRICEKVLGPEHPNTAISLNNLAALLESQGNYEEAKPLYERALRIVEKVLGPEHPQTAASLGNLALLLSNLGEVKEAWELTQRAITAGEAQLQHILWSLSEHERLLYVAKNKGLQEVLLSLGRTLSSVEKKIPAYEALLRWKGRVSRSLLQSKERLAGKLTPGAREILSNMQGIQSQLSKALFAQEIKDPKIHEAWLSRLRKERAELEERLVQHIGRIEEKPLVRIKDLRAALPESSAIVDFYVHHWYEPAVRQEGKVAQKGKWCVSHLSAWIQKGEERLIHLDLGPAETIRQTIASFRETLKTSRGISISTIEGPSPLEKANAALRSLLWDPIVEYVKDVKTVFISPDQFLGTIPFEVLQNKNGTYLIEDHSFVYLQDMVSLLKIVKEGKEDTGKDRNLLVVGGVNYRRLGDIAWKEDKPKEGVPLEMPKEPFASDLLAKADERGSFRPRWNPLPATRDESIGIVDMHEEAFEERRNRLLLQGPEATEERLKYELPHYNVLHLATHGFFQPEGLPSMWDEVQKEAEVQMVMGIEAKRVKGMLPGLLSGLVCAGVNRPVPAKDRDDGFLTAEEISWLDLSKVDLVVLSACETGLGEAKSGEGMIGLRRTFRQAGAKTVISSLWNVGDETTSELMQNFYEGLWLKGENKLDALRNAQLDMLKKNRIEHNGNGLPVTWGAFVLDGDWR